LTTNIWENGLENGIRLFKSLKNTVSVIFESHGCEKFSSRLTIFDQLCPNWPNFFPVKLGYLTYDYTPDLKLNSNLFAEFSLLFLF
jgi:hypothetical protein